MTIRVTHASRGQINKTDACITFGSTARLLSSVEAVDRALRGICIDDLAGYPNSATTRTMTS
jgi:hypothetical protein